MRVVFLVLVLFYASLPLLTKGSPILANLYSGDSGEELYPHPGPRYAFGVRARSHFRNSDEAEPLEQHRRLRASARLQESEQSEEEEAADDEGDAEEDEYAEEVQDESESQDESTPETDLPEHVAVHQVDMSQGRADESDLMETDNADLDQIHEPAMEPAQKVSSASRIPTQLSDAPMAGGEFRGIPGGIVDGTNITHLSYMIFKLIKKHKITSVVDMPCRNTLHWFPSLLHRLDFEVVGFKYYCVDTEESSHDDIKHLFGDAASPEFLHVPPEASNQLPKTDLLFSWNGPQSWGVRQSWAFFNGIRQVRPEFILITNNPGASNANGNVPSLNVRKQPFHFAEAMRVISNMHVPPDPPKQLLMYEMDGIRKGF